MFQNASCPLAMLMLIGLCHTKLCNFCLTQICLCAVLGKIKEGQKQMFVVVPVSSSAPHSLLLASLWWDGEENHKSKTEKLMKKETVQYYMLWNILLVGWGKLPQLSIPSYFYPSLVSDSSRRGRKGHPPV